MGRALRVGPHRLSRAGAGRGGSVDRAQRGRLRRRRSMRLGPLVTPLAPPADPEARPRDGHPRSPQRRPADPRRRAGQRQQRRARGRSARSSMPASARTLFDDGLERLAAMWGGEFEPPPGPAAADPGVGGGALAQPAAGAPRRALGRAVPDRDARSRGAGRARAGDRRGPRRRAVRHRRRDRSRGGPRPVGAGRGHLGAHRVRAPAALGRGPRGDRRRALDGRAGGRASSAWRWPRVRRLSTAAGSGRAPTG